MTVFLTANAQAIPLRITATYYTPTVGPLDASFSYSVFEAPANAWPTSGNKTTLGSGGGTLAPGVTYFDFDYATDLSDLYFIAWGGFNYNHRSNIFVAERPDGYVSSGDAWAFGPPWIALADLESLGRLSGDLYTINGYDNQVGSSHPWLVGTWEVTAVPEPSSILMVVAGLAMMAGLMVGRRGLTPEK